MFWSGMKEGLVDMNNLDGVTITFNDANHSYTMTCNNFTQTLFDEDLAEIGLKINQNGTKLKMLQFGAEGIYTKQ
jgi:hypothetical protein